MAPKKAKAAENPEAAPEIPAASPPQRLKRAFERAKAIEGMVDRLISHAAGLAPDELDPAEATAYVARRLLLSQVVDASALLSPKKMARLKPAELARFIMQMESTRLAGDRLRIRHEKLYAQARRDILEEMHESCRGRPDLLEELQKLLPPAQEPRKGPEEHDSPCPQPSAVLSK
ncbi:MAG: hypothetical protein A3J27_13385 [Candidatus Tectomicrobia bacterium RIFCSPLOWO2_12_FULL_69_37]|nr:MAG: hypothetical protein A3J27_13385 [Candidatus Tectomicrobia bacterium RIFCSPLOWO2_12_FULL_69_37]OGL65443.1 MAG: hypothetical protein A3I72_03155 [Candidatus Tectomicrobia bacterium RIFCSPLOWO2_02_FULL_70_19]